MKRTVSFSYQELDDLDSALVDSVGMSNPSESWETFNYAKRCEDLRVKIGKMMDRISTTGTTTPEVKSDA